MKFIGYFKKRFFAFGLLFLTILCFAKSSDKYGEIQSLLQKAREQLFAANAKETVVYASEAFSKSKKLDYSEGITRSALYISQGLYVVGEYRKALDYLSVAKREPFFQKNNALKAEDFRIKGRIFGALGLKKRAVTQFQKALYYAKKSPEQYKGFLLNLAYKNLAVVYNEPQETDSAYFYLNKNRALLKTLKGEQYDINKINLLTNLGNYFSGKKQYDSAYYYFNLSEQFALKSHTLYLSFNYKNLGDMELNLGNYEKAEIDFKKAEAELNKNTIANEQEFLYSSFIKLYEKTGNLQEANDYKIKLLTLKKNIENNRVNAVEYIMNSVLKEESEKNRIKNRTLIILVSGFFLLMITSVTLYFMKKQKQKNRILKEKERNEFQLQRKVNDAFEEVVDLARKNRPEFFSRFQEIYPDFVEKILSVNSGLRTSELTLCAYIFLGFNTKDIALFTNRSVSTIRNRKYSLRKKLHIPTDESLDIWIKNLP